MFWWAGRKHVFGTSDNTNPVLKLSLSFLLAVACPTREWPQRSKRKAHRQSDGAPFSLLLKRFELIYHVIAFLICVCQ